MERLFHSMAVHGVKSFAIEVHQKNFNKIQFYNSLGCRLRQSYILVALEM